MYFGRWIFKLKPNTCTRFNQKSGDTPDIFLVFDNCLELHESWYVTGALVIDLKRLWYYSDYVGFCLISTIRNKVHVLILLSQM